MRYKAIKILWTMLACHVRELRSADSVLTRKLLEYLRETERLLGSFGNWMGRVIAVSYIHWDSMWFDNLYATIQ